MHLVVLRLKVPNFDVGETGCSVSEREVDLVFRSRKTRGMWIDDRRAHVSETLSSAQANRFLGMIS